MTSKDTKATTVDKRGFSFLNVFLLWVGGSLVGGTLWSLNANNFQTGVGILGLMLTVAGVYRSQDDQD